MTMTMQEYLTRQEQRSTTQTTDAKINYFNSLKSSGQTAIVRFYPYKEANDFKFTFTHSANKGGKFFGRIKCLREDSSDDRSLCPACAAGGKLEARVYIKMLVYTPTVDPTTNAQVQVAEPVVWDRPTGIVTELLSKLSTYGLSDLSQTVFKITRQGTSRQDTRYTIDYLPSDMANPQVYSNDFSAFNGYDEIARAVRHLPAQTMLNEMAEGMTFAKYESKKTPVQQAAQPQFVSPDAWAGTAPAQVSSVQPATPVNIQPVAPTQVTPVQPVTPINVQPAMPAQPNWSTVATPTYQPVSFAANDFSAMQAATGGIRRQ